LIIPVPKWKINDFFKYEFFTSYTMKIILAFAFLSIVIIGLIISPSITSINADNHEIMSPYQQIKNGVAAKDVICKSDLSLMIRPSGNPACVQRDSIQRLGDMAWGFVAPKMEEEQMDEENHDKEIVLEEELSMGEQEQMDDNSNQTIIKLEEEVSAGEEDTMSEESTQ